MSTHASTHTYTIKDVSSLTGLPASTLRYYESIGIIKPISRGSSTKHREYDEQDLGIIDAVACLSAIGMSIHDMRAYLSNRSRGADGASAQIELLTTQKQHLAQEAKMLRIREEYVQLKIEYWQAVASGNELRAEQIGEKARKLADIIKLPSEL